MTTERSGMSLEDKVAEFVGAVACNGSLSSWAVGGICELIRSHLSRDAVVSTPPGYVLVPVEPTEAMRLAANKATMSHRLPRSTIDAVYKAMLAQRDGGDE